MYALGIDLGTTFTAAAVWREGRAEICSLGTRTASIPSVVWMREDDSILTGEAANRRALIDPQRVAREFKRRFGDSTPVLLAGSPYSPEALTARLLSSVVAQVAQNEGGPPRRLCVSHPANWGPFKTDLLRQAVRLANLDMPVTFTTEPEAAAVFYAREQRLAVGDTVAVYDLGGGTFDAAVLRRTASGFEILGQPEGIERLGGIDIDAAVFSHVVSAVRDTFSQLDEDDPAAITAVARLRQECTDAKEALSSDTDVSIPVILPGFSTEVRLTRAELESMVRPSLYDSIEAMRRALRSASVEASELAAVLLVGGSSRMPLVAQLVGGELGQPVAVDAHPKHSVALGAAWVASGSPLAGESAPAVAEPVPPPAPVAPSAPVAAPQPVPAPEPVPVARPVAPVQ
ncbi:MAG TPA: Hsp70 family protein, partial [Kineosporiaceae bacterium]|nr:Hsp70 family protein [Kineosporiaceae bacterium]